MQSIAEIVSRFEEKTLEWVWDTKGMTEIPEEKCGGWKSNGSSEVNKLGRA